ncbi:hypothetical protein K493DRAFT_208853 [Basidiobolus meristosporus CBS 931.73]|uniref:Uncharacterized protein n=1 Tax=Basidiobolus meristosporus CBS 931.73 TaxID=1314790 RepID=A0A1Y1YVN9_9FUNG|nr:hypothetical protein K493DRAFT_208853 [Basidiobolus meristosporus CBS 931.73]|eukprot:ORY02019.1 hypothetical protein K493DRAFT_208853 [Basidiobolus meristosporus CBS 931.73]
MFNNSIKKHISLKYYQYELVTCIYMLEPWEKVIFNSFVLTSLLVTLYFGITYLPIPTMPTASSYGLS